jgi:hypothetical protein
MQSPVCTVDIAMFIHGWSLGCMLCIDAFMFVYSTLSLGYVIEGDLNFDILWQMVRPVAVEDVKREVKILKELKGHENIVHFYNAF